MIHGTFPDGYLLDGLVWFDGPAGGYVSAGMRVDLPDLMSASSAACNQAQDAFSMALRQHPIGMRLQMLLNDESSEEPRLRDYQAITETCSSPTTRLVRNANSIRQQQRLERRELRSKRLLFLVGQPLDPSAMGAFRPAPKAGQYHQLLDAARSNMRNYEQCLSEALAPIGGRVTPVSDLEMSRIWLESFNPSMTASLLADAVSRFRPDESLLSNCWHTDMRATNTGLVIGEKCHRAFSFKRLASRTYFTCTRNLVHLPFGGVTMVAHLRRLNPERVLRDTQRELERVHRQLQRMPNERLSVTEEQLREKQSRLAAGDVVPLELELIVIVRAANADELAARSAVIKSAIQGMDGAQYYEATLATTTRDLFTGSLAGWMWRSRRGFVHYVEDRTAVDMSPLGSDFRGHPGPVQALFDGARNNLVNFVCVLGEGSAATPQNLLIFGLPGSGKSLMLLKLLQETAAMFGFTVIIEEGLSLARFSKGIGVEPIVFRLDGTQTLNPFDTRRLPFCPFALATLTALLSRIVGVPSDEDRARRQAALISRHLELLFTDHAEEHLRTMPEQRRAVVVAHALAVEQWAEKHRVSRTEAFTDFREWQRGNEQEAAALLSGFPVDELREFESTHAEALRNMVFAHLAPEEHLTLSSFREHLLLAEENEEDCRWLATLITPWLRGRNYGCLLDGVSNVSMDGPGVHMELGQIPEAAHELKAVAGFLVVNNVRQQILNLPKGMLKRVVIEELSRFIDIPGAEGILRELSEQFRKHGTQIIGTLQSYTRLADTPIRTAFMGNARALAIFNTGDRADIERLAHDVGLSEAAVETILTFPRPDQQAGAKYSEFLYWHSNARRPVCGPVRYFLLPNELPLTPATNP